MRTYIQNKLSELANIECGEIIADDIIEDNITYFGYQINKSYIDSDFDSNHTYRVNITGFVTRRIQATENTTQIVDEATETILDKLKEINFKCNSEDVSIENNIKKSRITGYVDYNEINNGLVF